MHSILSGGAQDIAEDGKASGCCSRLPLYLSRAIQAAASASNKKALFRTKKLCVRCELSLFFFSVLLFSAPCKYCALGWIYKKHVTLQTPRITLPHSFSFGWVGAG